MWVIPRSSCLPTTCAPPTLGNVEVEPRVLRAKRSACAEQSGSFPARGGTEKGPTGWKGCKTWRANQVTEALITGNSEAAGGTHQRREVLWARDPSGLGTS